MRRAAPLILSGALALAACVGDSDSQTRRGPARAGPPPRAMPPIASLLGEPLAAPGPGVACETVQGQWFDRADGNRDGVLDRAEFLADALRWFAVADVDHDGSIAPAELGEIRARFNAPRVMGTTAQDPDLVPPAQQPRRPGAQVSTTVGGSGGAPSRAELAREPIDPVMAADTNLDFRVSQAEFQIMVEKRFAALDPGKQGTIAKAALVAAACAKP